MARKRLTSLPEGLWSKLAELEAYVRQLDIVRGIGWTLAIAAVSVGLGLLTDMLIDLPISVRIGLLVLAVMATAAGAYGMIWRAVWRQRSVLDLAAVVERAHPQLKEGLVSCIELYDTTIPEAERGSALMREMAARQALQAVAPLDFCAAISPRPAHRLAIGGVLAWTLLLVPLLVPSSYRLLMTRFWTPWQNLDRVTTFWFEVERGDRVVVRGSDVTLAAHPQGSDQNLPATAQLNWVNEQGETDSRRLDYDAATGLYSTTIPHVMQGFHYDVSGAGNRSRRYQIQVVEAPAITSLKVEVQPPAYTGQPAHVLDGPGGEIVVLERSRLHWQLTFNKPVQAAEWYWSEELGAAAKPIPHSPESPDQARRAADKPQGTLAIPFKLAPDRLSATWAMVPEHGGLFRVVVRDEFGLTNDDTIARHLVVTPDAPPTLKLSGSGDVDIAQGSDLIPVRLEATDDFGIGALELHYEVDPTRKGILKCESRELGKARIEHQFDLPLAELNLRNGEVISYRVRAADERPIPGPNETWSSQRFIRIDAQAKPPGTQQLALEQNQLQAFLKQLQADVTAQQQQAEQLQQQSGGLAPDNQAAGQELQKTIERAADQQAKLQARLEQLAAAFDTHPLLTNLTQKAQQIAAEEFSKAQAAWSAAEAATGAPRTEQLQAARNELAHAGEQLGALGQQLEKLAQLERELLELDRLAASAEQLAQRLKALDQRPPTPGTSQETPQERDNRELLQQAEERQMLAQQKDLIRQAADLLQKQPELQQLTRQAQTEQLTQLARAAEQLAKPQAALADELQSTAEKMVRDTEALTERHLDLQQQVEQLNEQLKQRQTAGAPRIDPSELEQALQELQAGNLGAAAQKEDELAQRLEELEKKLQAANQSNADQAQQLADRQAAAAKAAREAAEKQVAPSAEQQQAAAEQLSKAGGELRKLAPEQALKEKQAAAAELDSATQKQQELAEKSRQPDPASKSTPEEREQELQRLLKENAAAQQTAAESLQKLANQLQPPAKPSAHEERPGAPRADDNKVAAADASQPKPQSAPKTAVGTPQGAAPDESAPQSAAPETQTTSVEQARQLAQAARDLQQEITEAQQGQDLSGPREKQKQLTETLRQLDEQIRQTQERMQQDEPPAAASKSGAEAKDAPAPAGSPSQPANGEPQTDPAQAAMEAAERELAQGNPARSAAAGKQAAAALQQRTAGEKSPSPPSTADQQRSSAESSTASQTNSTAEKSPLEKLSTEAPPAENPGSAGGQPAAGEPGSPERNSPETVVPREAAGQVTEAVRQLQAALATPAIRKSPPTTERKPVGNTEPPAQSPATPSAPAASSQASESSPTEPTASGQPTAGEAAQGEAPPAATNPGPSEPGNAKSAGAKPGDTTAAAGQPGTSKSTSPDGAAAGASGEPASGQPAGSGEGSGPASRTAQSTGTSPPSPSPAGRPAGSTPTPTPLRAAARRLELAAAALRQANAQWQSKSAGPAQVRAMESGLPAAEGGSLPGEGHVDRGHPGDDPQVDVDLKNLSRLKKRLAGRKWGELPGTLQTEILQAAQKKPNSEYGELIRQYFKEIAKTQPATTAP